MLWAQGPSASPKANPRGSARAQSSGAAQKKNSAGAEKANAETKKGPDLLGGDNQAKGPTEITAKDEVQFDGQARMAVFIGSVKVIDPQFTMTTDKLTVWMNKQEEGGGLREAQADGNVIIVHANPPKDSNKNTGQADPGGASPPTTPVSNPGISPQAIPGASPSGSPQQLVLSTGRAQKAIYNAKEDAVTLIGWPQVTQGVNTHIAMEEGTRMILYRDGRLQTFGASRTVIQDKSAMSKPSPNELAEPNKPQKNAIH
jgi:lipopolysaccharide export system protein LptA